MAKSISELCAYNKNIQGDELLMISKFNPITRFYESNKYGVSSLINEISSDVTEYLSSEINKISSCVKLDQIANISADPGSQDLVVSQKLLGRVVKTFELEDQSIRNAISGLINKQQIVHTAGYGEVDKVASQKWVKEIEDNLELVTGNQDDFIKKEKIVTHLNELSVNKSNDYVTSHSIVKHVYDSIPQVTQSLGYNKDIIMSQKAVTEQITELKGKNEYFLNKSGDTMIGPLTLDRLPTSEYQAVPKKYVDDVDVQLCSYIDKQDSDNTKLLQDEINEVDRKFDGIEARIANLAFDLVYPIGSIFISIRDDQVPSRGQWVRIAEGKCLWGANNNYRAGQILDAGLPSLDGIKVHVDQLKTTTNGSHNHKIKIADNALGERGVTERSGIFYSDDYNTTEAGGAHSHIVKGPGVLTLDGTYDIYGKSTTVQPPAQVVSMWKRVDGSSNVSTIPLSPPNLVTADGNKDNIVVNWSYVSNAMNYKIYRSEFENGDKAQQIGRLLTGTTYIDNVGYSKAYYYAIAVINSAGIEGERSKFVRGLSEAKPFDPFDPNEMIVDNEFVLDLDYVPTHIDTSLIDKFDPSKMMVKNDIEYILDIESDPKIIER